MSDAKRPYREEAENVAEIINEAPSRGYSRNALMEALEEVFARIEQRAYDRARAYALDAIELHIEEDHLGNRR